MSSAAATEPFTFRWDLDKTYIRTDFDGVGALLKTALQKPEEKETVPGAGALIRELRATHPGNRLCILSGSPKIMRKVLTAKLQLDGVEPDEFVLKPQVRNLMRGRFRAFKEQLGYKLPALLEGRRRTQRTMREICFGDDAELDAFIYSIYADILTGRVTTATLTRVLTRLGVYDDDASHTVGLACAFEPFDAVQRIYIHLDRYVPLSRFEGFGPRVVALYNYFQAALVLANDGVLGMDAVVRVLEALFEKHGYELARIANSMQDVLRRGLVSNGTFDAFLAALEASAGSLAASMPPAEEIIAELARRRDDLAEDRTQPVQPKRLDYLSLLDGLGHGEPGT